MRAKTIAFLIHEINNLIDASEADHIETFEAREAMSKGRLSEYLKKVIPSGPTGIISPIEKSSLDEKAADFTNAYHGDVGRFETGASAIIFVLASLQIEELKDLEALSPEKE